MMRKKTEQNTIQHNTQIIMMARFREIVSYRLELLITFCDGNSTQNSTVEKQYGIQKPTNC